MVHRTIRRSIAVSAIFGLALLVGHDTSGVSGRTSVSVPSGATAETAVAEPGPSPEPEATTATLLEKVQGFLDEQGVWLPPEQTYAIARAVDDASRSYELEPELVLAVISTESSFDPRAISSKGAVGLMQLLPSTAQDVARAIGIEWTGDDLLHDPEVNIQLGTHYLAQLLELFGDRDAAITAYNFGPNRIAVMRERDVPIPTGYKNRVLSAYDGLR